MPSKRYLNLKKKIEADKKYQIDDACQLIADMGNEKYDQSVDVVFRLGVDAKQSDQQVRGAVNLPHGLGKKFIVVAFAKGEKEKEALDAGADYIGNADLVEKINGGWVEFDKVVATPDMMALVSKVGKVLGPRSLMPNPKTGTVTFEIGKAVKECKAGKVAFKTEKAGLVHCAIGKVSFGKDKIKENFLAIKDTVSRLKPSSSKGAYFRTVALSTTHGPSVRLDISTFNG